MAKTQNKTTETTSSVADFISTVKDETKRKDCFELVDLIKKQIKLEPKMWGPAIVGFGSYHYKYESGREGTAPLIGFSPRANAITLYMKCDSKEIDELLKKLGKHTTTGGCIYVKKLQDIDIKILSAIIKASFDYMKKKHSAT